MSWHWPLGARVVLIGSVIVCALGLAVASRGVGTAPGLPAVKPDLILDPNTAPPQVLSVLPHIGPALARRIVEARVERPFTSLDDLRDRVRGLGPVHMAAIAPYIQIEAVSRSGLENLAGNLADWAPGQPPLSRRKPSRSEKRKRRPAQPPETPQPALTVGSQEPIPIQVVRESRHE
jgi:hypothetical protein